LSTREQEADIAVGADAEFPRGVGDLIERGHRVLPSNLTSLGGLQRLCLGFDGRDEYDGTRAGLRIASTD
jgi:hypothetical protein